MNEHQKRSNFTGSIGFVLAAAGSAIGLGNIWRFPYLAAKNGGGVFLLCYLILAVTFGFTMLTTEIAIGRKTRQSPLTAYGILHPRWNFLGLLACLVPVLILPYYCTIGGWVLKYLSLYVTGNAQAAIADGYFSSYIASQWQPIIWFIVYLGLTSAVVFLGVNKGIENWSKILLPILLLLIIGISCFSLTLRYTDAEGVTRTGLEGLKVYLIPNFEGMTLKKLFSILVDAMGQLFYSISVAMGIMVTYGSYARKESNLLQSVNQIEFFDSLAAFLAGMMIIPAVFTFMGMEGMSSGPGLMFISLPKIFEAMGPIGNFIGVLFFLMVIFAAITSSVSVMEAIVASVTDKFHISRNKATALVTLYGLIGGIIVCLGYNILFFDITLPNGSQAQILDVMDYISNNCLMPAVGFLTCVLVGWVIKPDCIIEEITYGGHSFSRKTLYTIMIKWVAPIMLFILLLQSLGLLKL